ncbi:Oligopeptide transport ATP-binding protein OppD [Acidihalobacter prosperus]|uniref:ABC-type dipeptide transporter n=1 Tax=Acidihalobacter prosperus TaxID=160660 RepID=A0A1A6C8W8_9GAMM|nr:Oligopeptide transport ATP-binding protein OppD [Acidihalobacter prosperus]
MTASGLTVTNAAGDAVLDGVRFALDRGERVGIIGESGSGKSVLLKAMLGLLPPGLKVTSGTLELAGRRYSLDAGGGSAREALRGRVLGYVPQDPLSSLTPVRKIGSMARETLRSSKAAGDTSRIAACFRAAGLPEIDDVLPKYPHQLSGGMRQRALIAMALLSDPEYLFCDEATTALDVLAQRQVVETLTEIAREAGKGVVLVSHDIALIAEMAEKVYVLYGGQVLECGPAESVTCRPGHPYTAALCDAIVTLGDETLPRTIPGEVPDPGRRGPGCVFAPRCGHADARCRVERPPLQGNGRHDTACWYPLNRSVGREMSFASGVDDSEVRL